MILTLLSLNSVIHVTSCAGLHVLDAY